MSRSAAALAAACLAGFLAAPPAAAATSSATYTVWQWNVAGNTMHGGAVDQMVDGAVSSIVSRGATFASLNELCWGQYQAIQDGLAARGWPADTTNFSRFAASRSPAAGLCGGGEEFGNAVFSKLPLGPAARITLPSDGSVENRNLLCDNVVSLPHVRFCTTHITTSNANGANGQPNNVNQLNAVLAQVEAYRSAGDTVIIAGDFNAQPHYGRLDNWYSPTLSTVNNGGNTGHYRELDDNDPANCPGYGEWTATGTPGGTPPCSATQPEGKIDLIFVREDRLAGAYSGDSLAISTACTKIPAKAGAYPAGSCSDHRILIGTVPVLTS
ncbi:endonuclease/exonuclease/phosphatase family protein [Hamadaea tsunoensis]|uniref:endonuclease/exonuclease/phosphatase family protein n=1 Tax=Hamadaea tsunoensis TaxID=53368 RepID=UPI00048006AB|nr:endonuclease/exonuclease/phosphatase family protein [Hamadaea tsunoensis]